MPLLLTEAADFGLGLFVRLLHLLSTSWPLHSYSFLVLASFFFSATVEI